VKRRRGRGREEGIREIKQVKRCANCIIDLFVKINFRTHFIFIKIDK
jgi:hypothetical protein